MSPQDAPAIGAVARDEGMTIIAGPCSVESREQMREVAACLSELGIKVMRGGAYKPRSSPFSFQGLEEKGLELLSEAADEYGLLVVTEVTDSAHAQIVDEYADILQIGTRNMANFSLLKKIGQVTAESGKPVVFKRGMAVDDRGVAAGHQLHHDARQRERDPVRARHPHLRDGLPLHARHHGGTGGQEALAPSDHHRRVASRRVRPTSCPPYPARRSPWARTASWSRCIPTRARRCATGRSRSISTSSRRSSPT